MKKIFSVVLCLSILFALSGCQKKDPDNGKLVTGDQMVQFQIWTAQHKDFLSAIGREFISSTGETRLQIKVVEFDDDAQLQKILVEKMAEGAGPDLVFTEGEWVTSNTKKLLPAANQAFNAAAYQSTFVRAANDTLIHEGEVYGVPFSVDSLALVYNDDHVVDTLLDRNNPGETWQQFKSDTELLSITDNSFERFTRSGAALGRMDNLHYGYEILENMLTQRGVKIFNDEGTASAIASKTGVSSSGQRVNHGENAFEDFVSYADPRYKNFSWSEFLANPNEENKEFQTFAEEKTSMIFAKAGDLETIENLAARTPGGLSSRDIRVAALPQFSATNKEVIGYPMVLVVPQSTKLSKIAWKILEYTTDKAVHTKFYETTGLPSSRLDLIAEQSQHPQLGVWARQAKYARAQTYPADKREIKESFAILVQKINTGQIAINRGIKELEDYWTRYVEKFVKRQQEIEG
jgi:ABC-type glycerol-3-phosphate transport system substrate-binding protein